MKAFYRNFKLGIIGGGQLGRMLLQACPNYNLYTRVLDPSKDGPCKGLANEYVQGSLQDYATVYAFGKQVDLLTIEIENVNVDALRARALVFRSGRAGVERVEERGFAGLREADEDDAEGVVGAVRAGCKGGEEEAAGGGGLGGGVVI